MDQRKIGIFLGGKGYKKFTEELVNLAESLNTRGNRIVVFTTRSKKLISQIKSDQFEVIKVKGKFNKLNFREALQFKAQLKKTEVDSIIFRDPELVSFLITTKYLCKGKPALIFLQIKGLEVLQNDSLNNFKFKQLDAWITPLNAVGNDVRSGTRIDSQKVHVLQYPLQLKKISTDPKSRGKIRRKQNIPDDLLVIGVSIDGMGIPGDLQTLINAISASKKLRKSSFLLISIHHPKEKKQIALDLEELLDVSDVFGMVIHTATEKLLTKNLSVCDLLFLIPSLEPFSGIGKLGLAAGIPCIAPNSITTAEILKNGELGALYSRERSQDLSTKLLSFVQEPEGTVPVQDETSEVIRNSADLNHFCGELERIIDSIPKADKTLY